MQPPNRGILDDSSPIGRIRKNFALVASGQVAGTGLAFAALALNARALGIEDLGRLFLIQATCELVASLIAFQNWQSFVKVGADIERRGSLLSLWRYGLGLDVAVASLAAATSAVLLLAVPRLIGLDPETAQLGLVYAASLLFGSIGTSVGALRFLGAFHQVVGVNLLQAALLLANAAILFAMQAPLGVYLISIPAINSLCGMLMIFLAYVRVRARDQNMPERRFDRAARRRFLIFAFGTSASSMLNAVRQRGEILIVGAILGPAAAALYGVAFRLAALLMRFAEAARVSVYPEFGRMVAGRQMPEAVALAFRLTRWSAAAVAPALLALALSGGAVLALLFGAEYRAAAPILLLLAVGASIYASIFALAPLVQVAYGSWRFFLFNLVAFAGFLVFAVLGPCIFGTIGVGAGSVAFSVILAGFLVWQTRKLNAVNPENLSD